MKTAVRILLVLAVLGAAAGPAEANHKKVCVINAETGGYRCYGTTAGHEATPVSEGPQTPQPVYPFREHWKPVLRAGPDGVTCVDTELVRLGREPTTGEDMNSEMQFLRFMRTYGICPDAAPLPTTTPAMEAASFLRQITLPTPRPYVHPGSLPVGFEAFLETGAPTSQTFGPVGTPFGPLTLTATAQIYVDWDDPHDDVAGEQGPYEGEPGPYPDGEIRHVYQRHGVYDIEVRYVWTANWSIGGVSGTIEGAETSGSYEDPGFEAYSREAVGR